MSKRQDLIECYDSQAEHFHHTRGFYKRPELAYVKPLIQKICNNSVEKNKKKCSFLDLGCGSGRIAEWLEHIKLHDKINYTGVDLSKGMINLAKEQYKDVTYAQFYCADMLEYIQQAEQQSTDMILSLAAFHHLETREQRLETLEHMYKALSYGGHLILINRSFSDRLLKKYQRAALLAGVKSLCTLNILKRNDLLIPWKDPKIQENGRLYHRYYHFFTLSELRKLIAQTEFILEESFYMTQDGTPSQDRKDSRNSVFILRKGVLLKNS